VTGGAGYQLVVTGAHLAEVTAAARTAPPVAVDTEAASFHRYRDRIYLLQLAAGPLAAVVDPLAVTDLAPLGALLADARIEKVFHDADYDLRTIDRDYGFRAARLFDTRIAAQLAGEPAIGLGALLDKYAGVKLAKAHQKADWSQRPLSPGMLTYAADDVRHLPRLRDALAERLRALGRLPWAEEEFRRLEDLRWSGPAEGEEAWTRLKGAKHLVPRQRAALRALVAWRETVAAREDKALFRIIGNEALVGVAKALPESDAALERLPELPRSLARRHGAALLAAVARARALPEADLPRTERGPRVPRDPAFEERVERLKAIRNQRAQALGLDPGVLCGRPALEAVARAVPRDRAAFARIPELRQWQVEVLGEELLRALG
jgi:ribonuclease D